MKRVLITIITSILAIILLAGCVLATTGKVNEGEVNFRQEPSTDGEAIRALSEGESVTIIEELDEWYKVQIGEETGYVYKTYITKDAEETSTTGTVTDSNATLNASNKTKITADCTAFVLPLLNSTKLQTFATGTEVEVISNAGNWSYVYTSNLSGWVISKNLESTKVSAPEKKENNTVENTTANTVNTVQENTAVNTTNTATANEVQTTNTEASESEEVVSDTSYPDSNS